MVTSQVEFWWIHSPEVESWAGLRIATFFDIDEMPFFMIHNEPMDRMGPRDWAAISKREGWRKVEQIPLPAGFKHRAPSDA